MTKFSERIQILIDKFGRKHLSEISNISTTQLHKLRTGGDTTRRNLIALSNSADVNFLWLGKGEGPMMKGDPDLPPPPPPEFTKDEIEMIELFRAVSLKKKSEILNQLMNND